tara:strand:+ start:19775 stop:22036 length:2262 start_codon:yes stop_codon:yes gene_type:complete
MARWILKINQNESIDDVVDFIDGYDSDDVSVKDVLSEIGMIVFFAPEEAAEDISNDSRLSYVVRDSERSVSDISVNEYEDSDVQSTSYMYHGSQSSTAVGEFDGVEEYYSHLELISRRDHAQTTSHRYNPTRTGKGVDCYIVDTGVNFDHPYLSGRVKRVPGFSLNLSNKKDSDDNGHGTYSALFCAGTQCGVAQDANIYAVKVMDSRGNGYNSQIAMGINSVISHHKTKVDYANKHNTHSDPSILNFSIGMMPSVSYPSFVKDVTGGDYITLDALKTAAASGVHVTAAAGNGFFKRNSLKGPMMSTLTNGQMNLEPTDVDNADQGQGLPIVVGATSGRSKRYNDDPRKMAPFSNYGKGNTINAPGEHLVSPSWSWSDSVGTTYAWKSGTSFATPITAGLLALHLEHEPTATPREAKDWLVQTASRGNIDNLMKPIGLSGGKVIFREDKPVVQIKYPDGVDLKGDNPTWKKLQITGIDGGDLLYFDDWYDLKWMSSERLAFSLESDSEFNKHISGDNIILANIDDTHESTDGIKEWQSESDDNLIVKHELGTISEYYYIGAVEFTDNLVLYNPYQHYKVEWDNVGTLQYDDNGLIGNKPSAVIKTMQGDIPFETTLHWVSGSMPCDIGAGGTPSEVQGEQHFGVISANNGYAEFYTQIMFEYTGQSQSTPDAGLYLSNKDGIISIQNGVEFPPNRAYFIVTDDDMGSEFDVEIEYLNPSAETIVMNKRLLKSAILSGKHYYTFGYYAITKVTI